MSVQLDLIAQNTFTPFHAIGQMTNGGTGFDLNIAGTFVGTLTLQMSYDRGTTVFDVKTYTAPDAEIGEIFESGVLARIGFKTGDFTSGAATVRLGNGAIPL